MINSRALQLLFLVSSMAPQMIGMVSVEEKKEIGEGIAQKIEELPKELRYNIFSSALALRENPKYEVYKKFDVGSAVKGIALTGDNRRALTGSEDGIALLWDVEKGTVLKELKGHTEPILSVALSADGTLALTGSFDGTARVWDINTGELITTLEVGSAVRSVALSANGTIALIGSPETIAYLYNTSTGELLKELKGHTGIIDSIALSSDGTLALTGSFDGTARLWNINTGESIILNVGSRVTSVALSADGALALIGSGYNNKILVWDTKSGSLLNRLLPNSMYVYSVALSKDGKRALTSTHEGTIQVWNTKPLPGQKETSTPLTVLAGHTDSVGPVAFGSADFIVSGSYSHTTVSDKTALIWKPFALEPKDPQENVEVLWQAYKETFSRALLSSKNEKVQG